jgi:hypothetical protein
MMPKVEKEQEDSDFGLEFYYNERKKEHKIEVYGPDNELDSVYEGSDFGEILRHAIYDIDPVLAASSWTKDYLEFSENRKIEEGPDI